MIVSILNNHYGIVPSSVSATFANVASAGDGAVIVTTSPLLSAVDVGETTVVVVAPAANLSVAFNTPFTFTRKSDVPVAAVPAIPFELLRPSVDDRAATNDISIWPAERLLFHCVE